MPNHYIGDFTTHHRDFGPPPVPAELVQLALVRSLTLHPVQMYSQFARHRYLRDLSPSAHG